MLRLRVTQLGLAVFVAAVVLGVGHAASAATVEGEWEAVTPEAYCEALVPVLVGGFSDEASWSEPMDLELVELLEGRCVRWLYNEQELAADEGATGWLPVEEAD